jgi:hypothetical protein
MVTYIPVNWTPARVNDLTLMVTGVPDAEDVVVEVLVGVVEVVVVVELVVGVVVVDVVEVLVVVVVGDDVVVVVVVVVRDGDMVKARFVLPCRVKVVVPPPPFALLLAKVPTFAPTT